MSRKRFPSIFMQERRQMLLRWCVVLQSKRIQNHYKIRYFFFWQVKLLCNYSIYEIYLYNYHFS